MPQSQLPAPWTWALCLGLGCTGAHAVNRPAMAPFDHLQVTAQWERIEGQSSLVTASLRASRPLPSNTYWLWVAPNIDDHKTPRKPWKGSPLRATPGPDGSVMASLAVPHRSGWILVTHEGSPRPVAPSGRTVLRTRFKL